DQHRLALEAALAALHARVAAIEEESANRARGLRECWGALSAIEQRLGALNRRIARLERDRARDREPRRLPLSRAAVKLGVSRDHALKLARRLDLGLVDLREPGAPQALWTVDVARLDALLEARRARAACLPDPADPKNGHPRADS